MCGQWLPILPGRWRTLAAGRPTALHSVKKISVPGEVLDITGAEGDMSFNIHLKEYLPENVRLTENGSGIITVQVYIEPKMEKNLTLSRQNISINNLPQGYTASIPEEINGYSLHVEGLAQWIDPLRSAELTGYLDIAAWMEEQGIKELVNGVYQIPISFNLADEITIVNPVMAQLVILKQEGDL